MSASSLALPPEFSFLSPKCRPSPEEVRSYADLINEIEHRPPELLESCLREAELQLWIWRNESRSRAPRRRRSARPSAAQADIIHPGNFQGAAS